MTNDLQPPTTEQRPARPPVRRRNFKWSRERRRRVAAMASGALIAMAIGFALGRWSVVEHPAAIRSLHAAAVSKQPTIETLKAQQDLERPQENPLSVEEEKLIEAIAQMPEPVARTDPRRPSINLQQIGSVGYFLSDAISVTKVIDASTFLGTTTWHSVQPSGSASETATYVPNRDSRYTILFRGITTFALHDEQVLMKNQGGIFDKAFVMIQPTRSLTALGTRTFMTVTAFDDTRVRALTDGKTSQEIMNLLTAIGRHETP